MSHTTTKYQSLITRWTDNVATAAPARLQDMLDEAADRRDIQVAAFAQYLISQLTDAHAIAMMRLYALEAYALTIPSHADSAGPLDNISITIMSNVCAYPKVLQNPIDIPSNKEHTP